jgi:hypothetical protein
MIIPSLLKDSRIRRIARNHGSLGASFFELVGDTSQGIVTEVRPLREQLEPRHPGVKDIDVVRIMQELEERGFGSFTIGRRGKPSRFEWGSALETSSGPDVLYSPAPKRPRDPSAFAFKTEGERERKPADEVSLQQGLSFRRSVAPDSHRVMFRLRKDYLVDFELPIDFSSEEAQRLCSFIKALPAPGETSRFLNKDHELT